MITRASMGKYCDMAGIVRQSMVATSISGYSDSYKDYLEKLFISMLKGLEANGNVVDYCTLTKIRNENSYAVVAEGKSLITGKYYCNSYSMYRDDWNFNLLLSDWSENRHFDHAVGIVDLCKFNHMSGETFYDLRIELPGVIVLISERTG